MMDDRLSAQSTLECRNCGLEVRAAEVNLHGRGRRPWYFNGYSRRLNPDLPEDIHFAVCPDCRYLPSDPIAEGWAWANQRSDRLRSASTGKASPPLRDDG